MSKLLRVYEKNPDPRIVDQAVEVLRKGGLIIYPTDTVYGLGCDITKTRALEKIARLKQVKLEKANFSFICYDLSNLSEYVKQIDTPTYKILKRALPGPYTFILKGNSNLPKVFKKKRTVGIRVPDNNIIRTIARELGNPIISTSIYDEDDLIEYTTDPELIYEKWSDKVEVSDLSKSKIDLSGWRFPITPREDWKQIFTDAWRMERDYFYDKNMHGVDWDAMHAKYLPLVDRITTRNELSDLIGRFVGELSALHTSVGGGDRRTDPKNITVASLGAEFSRDVANKGYKIDYIYQVDPDYPDEKSPLDDPYLDVRVGDIVTKVNGRDALSSVDMGELIRNQANKQVRLSLVRGTTKRDIIVKPLRNEFNLRYRDWEYGKRLEVETKGKDSIGYLHLRAMGNNDISQFYREFYPVFNKSGLILDVRYNWGGNIDSFILEKLLRKAWMYWKGRSGKPSWNMPYSFRGHIVVLVNENTYSDGEAFADGFKKLELGTTIGTRTWGGEIWLNSNNRLTDNGIARAPMFGVYGDNGEWLIEGHGFVPDIEIDNLPHATFKGEDAQLDAAIELLQKLMKEDPRAVPPPPDHPDKSFENNSKK